jgi:hypothetical protein
MRGAAKNLRIRKEPAASALAEVSRRSASGASSAYLPQPEANDLGSRTANDRNEFAERPLFDEVLASFHT